MAEDGERVRVGRIPRGQDLERLAVLERQAEILDAAVRANEHRLLGEAGADLAGRVEPRRSLGKFKFRFVGQIDLHDRTG